MGNIVAAFGFVGFLLLVAVLSARSPGDPGRRSWTTVLILYCIALTSGAVLLRRDFWPFSAWSMMGKVAPRVIGDSGGYYPVLVGVPAGGREYPIDCRVWEPLNCDELATWFHDVLPRLSVAAQDSVGAYLLTKANVGRESVRAGHSPGSLARIWGPFAAPGHLVHTKLWTRPEDVPLAPFVEFRLYRQQWDVEARARDASALHLTLVYRFPHP